MIFDTIENLPKYSCLHPAIASVLEIISDSGFRTHPDGPVESDRGDLGGSWQTYTTVADKPEYEFHRVMADLQVMIFGREIIRYSRARADMDDPAFEKADIAFMKAEEDSSIILSEGTFAIYFPGELHMPGLAAGGTAQARKAVFKLKF